LREGREGEFGKLGLKLVISRAEAAALEMEKSGLAERKSGLGDFFIDDQGRVSFVLNSLHLGRFQLRLELVLSVFGVVRIV
jgi:hypothetical protein